MTTFHRNDIVRKYLGMLQTKETSDICWFFYHEKKGINVFNKEELQEQMKEWRKLALDGKIVIMNYNNKKQTTFDGKEWYILVVQPKDEDSNCPFDPIGSMLLGYVVCGYIYCFKTKKNRDDVAKYVMRKLDAGEETEVC